jgi:hypothetical protein
MDGRAEPAAPPAAAPPRRHSRWMWVSVVLALVAVGVTIWALTLNSDLDTTQQELDKTTQEQTSTKQELDTTKQQLATTQQDVNDLQSSQRKRTGLALGAGKVVYDEFAKQLGATQDELAATQQDVKDANQAATQARAGCCSGQEGRRQRQQRDGQGQGGGEPGEGRDTGRPVQGQGRGGLRQGLRRGVGWVVRRRPGRGGAQGAPERHRRLQGRARGRVARGAIGSVGRDDD